MFVNSALGPEADVSRYNCFVSWAIFDTVSAAEAQAVLSVARRRKFKRGETIFHEGDPGDALHLIEQGHVALRVTTPMGEVATLRILGPGDHFGELAVVSPAPRNATVVAVNAVETRTLHRDQLAALRGDHPGVDAVLLEAVIAEVRRLSLQLTDAMFVPVPKRLARRLAELADQFRDGTGTVEIPLTQDDVAGLVGTTRPTVNKCLQELADNGAIALSRGRVTVLDEQMLARKGR